MIKIEYQNKYLKNIQKTIYGKELFKLLQGEENVTFIDVPKEKYEEYINKELVDCYCILYDGSFYTNERGNDALQKKTNIYRNLDISDYLIPLKYGYILKFLNTKIECPILVQNLHELYNKSIEEIKITSPIIKMCFGSKNEKFIGYLLEKNSNRVLDILENYQKYDIIKMYHNKFEKWRIAHIFIKLLSAHNYDNIRQVGIELICEYLSVTQIVNTLLEYLTSDSSLYEIKQIIGKLQTKNKTYSSKAIENLHNYGDIELIKEIRNNNIVDMNDIIMINTYKNYISEMVECYMSKNDLIKDINRDNLKAMNMALQRISKYSTIMNFTKLSKNIVNIMHFDNNFITYKTMTSDMKNVYWFLDKLYNNKSVSISCDINLKVGSLSILDVIIQRDNVESLKTYYKGDLREIIKRAQEARSYKILSYVFKQIHETAVLKYLFDNKKYNIIDTLMSGCNVEEYFIYALHTLNKSSLIYFINFVNKKLINYKDKYENNVLLIMCDNNKNELAKLECVKVVLEFDKNLVFEKNIRNENLLHICAKHGNTTILLYLLSTFKFNVTLLDDNNNTFVHLLVQYKECNEITKKYLHECMDFRNIEQRTILMLAYLYNNIDIIDFIYKNFKIDYNDCDIYMNNVYHFDNMINVNFIKEINENINMFGMFPKDYKILKTYDKIKDFS